MIRLEHVNLRRGTKVLLQDASTVIHAGEKVGLIGPNGAGKSSLFALLRNELGCDAGSVQQPQHWRVAHVAQESITPACTALDFVIEGDDRLRALTDAICKAEADHSQDPAESGERLGELHGQFEDAGGYSVRARAQALLLGLGFSLIQTEAAVASFSGGWRMRLSLARALMSPSDLLLLDEPTNHLDLDAIVWLEQWLRRYAGTLIVISHDREFLDAVCMVILRVKNEELTRYTGNYSAFEVLCAEQVRQGQFAFAKQQRDIAHLRKFVDRFKAKASKAKQAQSRVKALERMEILAPAHADSPFSFRFRAPDGMPDPMLVAENLSCGYSSEAPPKRVLSGVNLVVRSGERIGLLGANGQGKSTFIKTLAGTLSPLTGELRSARGLAIGYFAQHQVDTLRLDETPLEQLMRIAPGAREQELRDYLGSFDFQGSMVNAPVAPFSGGEKARLALALLIWRKPNLLLLDEPTNHLDLEMRDALTRALAQFEGAVILVSHDRSLLRATTDQFILVANAEVRPFSGDLEEYRDWLLAHPKSTDERTLNTGGSDKAARVSVPEESQGKQKRRLDATTRNELAQKRRPLESRIKRVEEQLAKLTTQKSSLDTQLSYTDTYLETKREILRDLLADQAYTTREIVRLEEEWLELHSLLEQLAA